MDEETVSVKFEVNNQLVGLMLANTKAFSTGSRGFFGTGKVQMNGKSYQTQVQMVEIGSKPDVGKQVKKKG